MPCPFCGLLCDDLRVSVEGADVGVIQRGCERGRTGFSRSWRGSTACYIDGALIDLEPALERAAAILAGAAQPLILSGGADVASMRALLALADRCGAVVDHQSDGLMRNLRALQDTGWIATTLTEIRNRADLIVCVGTDVSRRFPRFFERCAIGGGMLDPQRPAPELVFLGVSPPMGVTGRHIDIPPQRVGEVFTLLRAVLADKPVAALSPGLLDFAERARGARYGVMVWSAADFDLPHADLTIQVMCEWVKDMNRTTRFSGLALGGTDGDITAHQTITWQSGFGLRTRFSRRGPEHDPVRYDARRLLDRGGVDALLYIAEIDVDLRPPSTSLPTIVLGRQGMAPPPCAVFIPVGAPGIDRTGHLYRTDSVVAVPMKKLVERGALAAPDVIRRITHHLEELPA